VLGSLVIRALTGLVTQTGLPYHTLEVSLGYLRWLSRDVSIRVSKTGPTPTFASYPRRCPQ